NETDIDVLIADQADEADCANENEVVEADKANKADKVDEANKADKVDEADINSKQADINDPKTVVNQHILRVLQVQE
ncbi:26634_t:CDS:1, partial [Gigaspora margarita]